MTTPLAHSVGPFQPITAARIDHLPIVAHFARHLGLVKIINHLVPVEMAVEPGIIVLGLILDTLSGRSPLYHLEKTFEDYDQKILFGQVLPPGYFNDDNVGRVMDHLYEAGTQKIFSALSIVTLKCFSLSTKHVHFDTTSVNVYGDFDTVADESSPFNITYGYSKDKRPDLKQFILSLLCVDGDIPIVGKLEDGNASDKKINHGVLTGVARHMKEHGVADDAFIYVADSAMVTEENLKQAEFFITRLPATYNECDRAILDAVDADQWRDIGCISQTPGSKKRPNAQYRVHEETVILYDTHYRAIVVHSSAHDRRRAKRLQRELDNSLKSAKLLTGEVKKKLFFCRRDAEQAAREFAAQTTQYHQWEVEVVECPRYAPGRPKKGTQRVPVSMEYQVVATLTEKEQEVTRCRQMIGCFVLLTNVPANKEASTEAEAEAEAKTEIEIGYSGEKILRTYKDQHGIENNFSFLKDDQIVNAIFLKRPERIEVLGLILLLSLLVWRLMEHIMRTELRESGTFLPGWDNKPTQRPTSYMLTWKFKGIMVICIGNKRQLAKPLSTPQKEFLKALKVPESCFY